MNYGTAANSVEKQSSQLDELLNKLDNEISRYFNALNDISNRRRTLQEEAPRPESNEKGVKPGSHYQPGVLYRLDSLIMRLAELNHSAEVEAKILNEYI